MKIATKIINSINNAEPHLAGIILLAVIFVFSLFMMGLTPLSSDLGEYVNNAFRVYNGELPYKDFWLIFPPGEVYFPALIYKIFGLNTDILRIVTVFFSSLSAYFTFYLCRQLFKDNAKSIFVASLFYFSSVATFYEGPDYISIFLLFCVLSVLFMIRFINNSHTADLLFSGLFIGISFFFRLYEVGSVLVTLMFVLLLYFYFIKLKFKDRIKYMSLFCSGVLFVIALIAIIYSDIALLMFNEVAVESLKNGTAMSIPYFFDSFVWQDAVLSDINLLSGSFSIGLIIKLIYHFLQLIFTISFYLIPFCAIFLYFLKLLSKPDKQDLLICTLLFLWGLLSYPKALNRSDLAHLAPAVAPFILFICYLYFKIIPIQRQPVLLKTGNYVSKSIIFIMLFVFTVPIYKTLFLFTSGLYKSKAPNGTIYLRKAEEAEELDKLLNYIETNSGKNDYIFVTPWLAPPLYALTGRKNSTYFDSLIDLIVTPSNEVQIKLCNDLETHKTKIIIHNPDWGFNDKPEQQFRNACAIIQNYIDSNYTCKAVFCGLSVYQRK